MVAVAFSSKSPDPIDKHVGRRVRIRRKMIGHSQTKLAEELGLTFQQIQKYEKGTNRISASKLFKISNVQQVPIEFYFDGAPGQRPRNGAAASTAFLEDFLASAHGMAIAQSFARIKSDKLRRRVVQLADEIATETAA